jgi:hypothetical protein
LSRTGELSDYTDQIKMIVFPALIRLFNCKDKKVEEKAPHVFAYLVDENLSLQKVASEIDVIPILCSALEAADAEENSKSNTTWGTCTESKRKEVCLICIYI